MNNNKEKEVSVETIKQITSVEELQNTILNLNYTLKLKQDKIAKLEKEKMELENEIVELKSKMYDIMVETRKISEITSC